MKKIVEIMLFVLLLVLPETSVRPTMVVRMNIGQMAKLAELIFSGTVTNIQSHWTQDSSTIFTDVTFSDLKVIKGKHTGQQLTLRFRGGVVDSVRIVVEGIPGFQTGSREILLAYEERPGRKFLSAIVGLSQGRFIVRNGIVTDIDGNPVVGMKGDELIFVVPPSHKDGGETSTFTPLAKENLPVQREHPSKEVEGLPRREKPQPPPKTLSYEPKEAKREVRESQRKSSNQSLKGIDYSWEPAGPPILLSPDEDPGTRFSENEFLALLRELINK